MKIAILGGGNGSYAAAADLAEAGHDVRLWRRDAQALVEVAGGLLLKDRAGLREVRLAQVSADIGAAVRGAELIVVPVPATAQADIARAMAPHLSDGQVVFLPPGTFGSYVMARLADEAGCRADVAWAETGTLPYLARKHGPREVHITMRAVRLPTGVYPQRREAHALEVIRRAYPAVHACGDALSGALMNAGPVIHPPLMVMNAAPLQHFERWDIHNEGTQQAVRAVTEVGFGDFLGGRRQAHATGDVAAGGEARDHGDRGIEGRDHGDRLGRRAGIGMGRGSGEADAGPKGQQHHRDGTGAEGAKDDGTPLDGAGGSGGCNGGGRDVGKGGDGHDGSSCSAQAEEGKNEHHDDDQSYEIDDTVHRVLPEGSTARSG